ncbi:MAG: pyridoxamine kinase [Ruminococcus sp.]|jgi:pyridoxine kinase|nr:pyridoxamine kinase [Ruminococcus sp.]
MIKSKIPRAALINDFSGFGRCSLSVLLPVLSVLGVQCCCVPTAVFTNHTGFESFHKTDLTEDLPEFINEWKKLDLKFDAIVTGYLCSPKQIEFALDFIKTFRVKDTFIIVDPVMGDNGKLYNAFSPETSAGIRRLTDHADIITPNLTESFFLAEMSYNPNPCETELRAVVEKIHPRKCVITGIDRGDFIDNFLFDGSFFSVYSTEKKAISRSGTGDLFAAVLSGKVLSGAPFKDAVKSAADFVKLAAEFSEDYGEAVTDGAVFEPLLKKLLID